MEGRSVDGGMLALAVAAHPALRDELPLPEYPPSSEELLALLKRWGR
jgi:hypothetical protein